MPDMLQMIFSNELFWIKIVVILFTVYLCLFVGSNEDKKNNQWFSQWRGTGRRQCIAWTKLQCIYVSPELNELSVNSLILKTLDVLWLTKRCFITTEENTISPFKYHERLCSCCFCLVLHDVTDCIIKVWSKDSIFKALKVGETKKK